MEQGVAHRAEGLGVLPKAEQVQNSLGGLKARCLPKLSGFVLLKGGTSPTRASSVKEPPQLPANCSSSGEGAAEPRVSPVSA